MRYKAVIATTHIDRHNCKITKEALEDAVEKIKHGETVPSLGLEHDSMIPPIGKVIDAWIEQLDDGEYRMVAIQETFDRYKEILLPDGSIAYEEYIIQNNKPFTLRSSENTPDKLKIDTDLVNFESQKEYEEFIKEINDNDVIEEGFIGRKSLIPDPEIVFTLTKNLILFFAGKHILERASDKIIDSMIEDVSKLYEVIKKAIVSAPKYVIPKNRPITYIFEAPGEMILEFVARTNEPNKVITALTQEKLKYCFEKAEELNKTMNADKIQYILNRDGDWEFNFLLTKTGSVIGTPASHKRRATRIKLMKEMRESTKEDKE